MTSPSARPQRRQSPQSLESACEWGDRAHSRARSRSWRPPAHCPRAGGVLRGSHSDHARGAAPAAGDRSDRHSARFRDLCAALRATTRGGQSWLRRSGNPHDSRRFSTLACWSSRTWPSSRRPYRSRPRSRRSTRVIQQAADEVRLRDYMESNVRFHTLIARASGNLVLAQIIESLIELYSVELDQVDPNLQLVDGRTADNARPSGDLHRACHWRWSGRIRRHVPAPASRPRLRVLPARPGLIRAASIAWLPSRLRERRPSAPCRNLRSSSYRGRPSEWTRRFCVTKPA